MTLFTPEVGEDASSAKRAAFAAGGRVTDIAREYGINNGHASRVLRRLVWKHI